jgi:hypothetical protein
VECKGEIMHDTFYIDQDLVLSSLIPFFFSSNRCIRTSLAVSRFLLALDPLRDPTGILLLLDYFALMSQSNKYDQFLVNLVESKKVSHFFLMISLSVSSDQPLTNLLTVVFKSDISELQR